MTKKIVEPEPFLRPKVEIGGDLFKVGDQKEDFSDDDDVVSDFDSENGSEDEISEEKFSGISYKKHFFQYYSYENACIRWR